MDVIDRIIAHRSIRKFKDKPIDNHLLERILTAGVRSATSGNMQYYSIIQTQNQSIKEQLYQTHEKQEMILKAPVVLTFCSDLNRLSKWMKYGKSTTKFDDFVSFFRGVIDVCLVAQNIAVASESAGLGICYMGTTLNGAKEIASILKLPKKVMPVTSMVIGYPDEIPSKINRLDLSSVVHQETYQDYSESDILKIFQKKDEAAWERLGKRDDIKKMIESSEITTTAQIYTHLKFSNRLDAYSKIYLDLLKKQWNLF